MNKKGYTLAEALITLGIIGIIAALVVPAANKARPNENKLRFLQTYDTIETQIKNFTQNSRYFPTCQDDFPDPANQQNTITRCFPDYPLYNTSAGVDDILRVVDNDVTRDYALNVQNAKQPNRPLPFDYASQDNAVQQQDQDKLCYLLADAMGAVVSDGEPTMRNRCDENGFVTPNNIRIFVNTDRDININNEAFLSTIIFDVSNNINNINNIPNANIADPSRFALYITADGSIYPAERATAYYLATRNDNRGKFDAPAATINAILDNEYGHHTDADFQNIERDQAKIRVIFSN